MGEAKFFSSDWGVTPDNLVMVDARRPNEIAVTYLDPFDGLSSTVFEDITKIKLPENYAFNDILGIGFNFDNIAAFVETSDAPEFVEVYVRRHKPDELPIKFDLKNAPIMALAGIYQGHYNHIPHLSYTSIGGKRTKVVTHQDVARQLSQEALKRIKGYASRPGNDNRGKSEKPSLDRK